MTIGSQTTEKDQWGKCEKSPDQNFRKFLKLTEANREGFADA